MLIALLFALMGSYSVYVTIHLWETVTVGPEGISQRRAGGEEARMRWDEITAVRDHAFLGRLDVFSRRAGTVIRIEHQMQGYAELASTILLQLGRLHAPGQYSQADGNDNPR